MKCPNHESWHLLSLGLLAEAEAAELYAHAEECDACRARLGAARRNHAGLLRAFEVFDHNHDRLREQLMAALPSEAVCEQPSVLSGLRTRPTAPADWFAGGWRRLEIGSCRRIGK